MKPAEVIELPAPVTDAPQYWLGQLAAISDLEENGTLTHARAVRQSRAVIQKMRQSDAVKAERALIMARNIAEGVRG